MNYIKYLKILVLILLIVPGTSLTVSQVITMFQGLDIPAWILSAPEASQAVSVREQAGLPAR